MSTTDYLTAAIGIALLAMAFWQWRDMRRLRKALFVYCREHDLPTAGFMFAEYFLGYRAKPTRKDIERACEADQKHRPDNHIVTGAARAQYPSSNAEDTDNLRL